MLSSTKNISKLWSSNAANLLLKTDVYKMCHAELYPPGTTKVYSYLQARSGKTFDSSVFYGLQYYLKEYLCRPITHTDVDEFMQTRKSILGSVSPIMENKLRNLADLGYVPLEIKSVPEGTVVPVRNVLMSMTNTHSDFYWTVGFFESLLLKLWYPISVATTSLRYRKLVDTFFDKTVDKPMHALKPFMVHDFGYRGDSSEESSVISGIGHLLSFTGSDTVPAFRGAIDYYGANPETIMKSVSASEHSVMCAFGKEGELDAFRNMLKVYPIGIISIVSDTYNIYKVMTDFAVVLRDDILKRDGQVVFRPDSGNPENIICGDPGAPVGSPEWKGCLRLLDEVFGSTINEKGYKVINPKVGLIYGDGMYFERYERTLDKMQKMGYASSNLVIGVGGLLRSHTRDTLGFAIKATKVEINGQERSIFKDPITDPGKKSHQGYLCLEKDENGNFITLDNVTKEKEKTGLLRTVFKDGKLIVDEDLNTVRNRVEKHLSWMQIERNFKNILETEYPEYQNAKKYKIISDEIHLLSEKTDSSQILSEEARANLKKIQESERIKIESEAKKKTKLW